MFMGAINSRTFHLSSVNDGQLIEVRHTTGLVGEPRENLPSLSATFPARAQIFPRNISADGINFRSPPFTRTFLAGGFLCLENQSDLRK